MEYVVYTKKQADNLTEALSRLDGCGVHVEFVNVVGVGLALRLRAAHAVNGATPTRPAALSIVNSASM